MTAPRSPIVPAWVSADWARFADQAVQHFCAQCESYAVRSEGGICPICAEVAK